MEGPRLRPRRWIGRFNTEGIAGLDDRKGSGRSPGSPNTESLLPRGSDYVLVMNNIQAISDATDYGDEYIASRVGNVRDAIEGSQRARR